MVINNRNEALTIGTDCVRVAEAKNTPSQRIAIYIINTSTAGQKITIAPGADAVAGRGIVISPGGYYQESADAGFIPTQDRVTAISDAIGGTISIHERVATNGF